MYDETTGGSNDDEEVAYDEGTDAFASYFSRQTLRFSLHQRALVGGQHDSVNGSPLLHQTHVFTTEAKKSFHSASQGISQI